MATVLEPETQAVALTTRLLSSAEITEALELWRALEAQTELSLFCSVVWVETWLRHYGDLVPFRFLAGFHQDEIVGIVLITQGVEQKDGPFTIRSTHLGTAGEPEDHSLVVEYNQWAVLPEYQAAFLQKLWQHLEADQHWKSLCLDGFTLEAAEAFLQETPHLDPQIRRSPSYWFDLATARESGTPVLEHFGKSTKKNLKRNLNRTADLKTEWAETVSEAVEFFDEMVQLHQQRWNAIGKPGAYASTRFLEYHRDLVQQLFPLEKLEMFRVRSTGETIGSLELWRDQNRVYEYQCGNIGQQGGLSAGLITDYLCIEASLNREFDAFDLLGGDTRHKKSLSTHANKLVWVNIQRPWWKFKALKIARAAKHSLKKSLSKKSS